ncbi:membrane-associated 30 kDa protein [Striga asiatica]|uniref:Membrane-associated 30 kDa protein n=1 Tax=Striga asiatica TaxID=4170 RepID=A0A5A7P707_STRAF|nr:membrane-associated 30 kDa protein [Striga asiatica]
MAMAVKAPVTGLSVGSHPAGPSGSSGNRGVIIVRAHPFRSSLFGRGVGSAPKFAGLQLSCSTGSRRNGRGRGGALGAQMSLFDRFARVVKSYANSVLSFFEDPEKILEQSVIEMNFDLVKMRQATAQVLASRKQLENKYKAAQQASEDWYRRAQLALGKGDEDLAREALKRRKSFASDEVNSTLDGCSLKQFTASSVSEACIPVRRREEGKEKEENLNVLPVHYIARRTDNANALKTQLDQQKAIVDNLVSNTRLLESKIQEAKSKTDTLKARAQTAKTATKVSEMLGNVNTSSALSAFEKMEEKVLAMESEADALNQLTNDELEGKFALLESSSVDDDLDSLKKQISGNTKKAELQLPAGRAPVTSLKFQDAEIEHELNELRQKAKEY